MKRVVFKVILGALFFSACTTKAPQVYWESLEVKNNEDGVDAEIYYPYRFGGIDSSTMKINDTINYFYTSWIYDASRDCSIDSTLTLLRKDKAEDSAISHIEYKLRAKGSFFVKGDTTTVFCEKEYYMGGANYMIDEAYINFNSTTGDIIEGEDLVTDKAKAKKYISKYLKEKYPPVDGHSLFFDGTDLDNPPMPKTIGLDSTGYVFLYNLYEIAPRSTGIIKINIPYGKL